VYLYFCSKTPQIVQSCSHNRGFAVKQSPPAPAVLVPAGEKGDHASGKWRGREMGKSVVPLDKLGRSSRSRSHAEFGAGA